MSKNLYGLYITFFTATGIAFAAAMSRVSYHWTWPLHNIWTLLGFGAGVLVLGLLGSVIFEASNKPLVSLFGYALVAGPFGLLLGPILAQYTVISVVRVFALTTVIVLVLGLVGAIIPDSLDGWGSWLLGGLVVLLVGYLWIPVYALFDHHVQQFMTIWDWAGIALFSGLTVYDLNRAMRDEYTLDNAIDNAAKVFMDFYNLLIRLLPLLAQSSSPSSS